MSTIPYKANTKRKLLAALTAGVAISAVSSVAFAQSNLIKNSTFDESGDPWVDSSDWGNDASLTAEVESGEMCVNVQDPGVNPWDVTLRHEGINLSAGTEYSYSFDVRSSQAAEIIFQVTHEPPIAESWTGIVPPTTYGINSSGRTISGTVTPNDSFEGVFFGFQMGSDVPNEEEAAEGEETVVLVPANTEVCFDNIELNCPTCEPEEPGPEPSNIHVNQAGYLPDLEKLASYALPEEASDPATARDWRLLQGSRADAEAGDATEVATGTTLVVGDDTASGDYLHTIDFSSVTTTGEEFALAVSDGADTYVSPTFSIGTDVYANLKYDALAYFYHNRAGSPVEAALVGSELARDAGHEYDSSLDTLGCEDGSFECRTNVDVGGGWYDAGDHGKYVVNGGISVWTMLNQYERATHLGANAGDFSDNTMAIPEAGNGVADILDEARYEIEWILKMQIPAGHDNAGMVYHKLHDDEWTGDAFNPATATPGENPRHIWPHSTAATLNFAAVGAQCYRVYKDIDPAFADECLNKAVTAYEAANSSPYQSAPYTHPSDDGGGQYEDLPGDRMAASSDYVQDEYYWAATELYIAATIDSDLDATTYASDMQSHPDYHLQLPSTDPQTSMTWAHVSGLGVMSLATIGDDLPVDASWVTSARSAVTQRADTYVAATESEGYGVPFNVDTVYWGSNSNVLNNTLVMGLARDFTGCSDDSYLRGMNRSMSYLLGRNPMGTAYVTGYGEKAVENPHHRYWAHSITSQYPEPPPGVLVGGPNTGKEDDKAEELLQGCDPLKCYLDRLKAFSTNEITINWNTPLAWAAAYMDEVASGATPQACGGLVAEDATLDIGSESSGTLDLAALNQSSPGDTFVLVDTPTHGSASISNGVLTYTVGTMSSTDSLTYEIHRGGEVSSTGEVTVQLQAQSPLSCSWQLVQDVDGYNNFWNAEILLENNTADDISGWELAVTVGADNKLGNEWHETSTYTQTSGDIATQSTWSVVDSGWNGFIPAGGNRTYTLVGFDPTVKHWEPGFDGYTPADIISIAGDCGTPAEKTVDVVNLEGGESGVFTGDDFITLSWYNNSGKALHIEDEQGNRLDLVRRDDGVRIIPDGNWTRLEARIHHLRELTSLDLSPSVHTWVVATDSGLEQETSESVSFTVSDQPVMRCDVGVYTRYSDGDWQGRFELTNTSDQVVTDWSLVMEWPDADYTDAPASIQNAYGSDQYTVEQLETWKYRIVSNGASIAPGESLVDLYHGHVWQGSDTWAVSDPVVVAEPGGLRCY